MSEEDIEAANTALLLHENISKRIRQTVGEVFHLDPTTGHHLPRPKTFTPSEQLRDHIIREVVEATRGTLLSDPAFVRELYDRMIHMNQERRMSVWNNTPSQQYF